MKKPFWDRKSPPMHGPMTRRVAKRRLQYLRRVQRRCEIEWCGSHLRWQLAATANRLREMYEQVAFKALGRDA